MPAYVRGDLSIEAYLVRFLAAICRQNGGEIRIKGELVDAIGEATALLKSWDPTHQEVVLTTAMGSFGEVFRVVPEKQSPKETVVSPNHHPIDPLPTQEEFLPKTSTVDNPRLAEMERQRKVRAAAALVQDELRRRKQQAAQG